MHGDQRIGGAGLQLRDDNLELARLNSRVASIKVSLRGLLAWGGLILLLSGPLSALTGLWWLILVFGTVLPLAIGLGGRISGFSKTQAELYAANRGEKELLAALEQHGEITPARAAIETSLTASEADRILVELASKGYLDVKIEGGKMSYALW